MRRPTLIAALLLALAGCGAGENLNSVVPTGGAGPNGYSPRASGAIDGGGLSSAGSTPGKPSVSTGGR